MTDIEVVIGLEIHAQISTKTKMFCGCDNDSFGKQANTNVCPICMGYPGVLPVPNKEAIEKGIKAALALKCKIPSFSKFDRKNYFYPDLPYGFQISQFDEPVSEKGEVKIKDKTIGVTRLHLENDAGKLTHTANGTLLDFNRAGTPLMEIVSEPDMRSASEAREYAETVQKILRYSGGSDCDMEKGMMRFDASVSIRKKGEKVLNPRGEIKNLNSFRSLEAAIEYEIQRQIKSPPKNDCTLGWDDSRGTTEVLREKESSADYRYFPEPDIPPILRSEAEQSEIELPSEKHQRFISEFGISEAEALFYTENINLANYFESVAKASNPKIASSFVGTILVKRLADANLKIADCPISPEQMIELIQLVENDTVSNNTAKTIVFAEMFNTGKAPKQIVQEQNLVQVSDTSQIEELCQKAIDANPDTVADVKGGKEKAMGALVGFVMKESRGQANPKIVNDILKKLLL